jgi:hypothetical protein
VGLLYTPYHQKPAIASNKVIIQHRSRAQAFHPAIQHQQLSNITAVLSCDADAAIHAQV